MLIYMMNSFRAIPWKVNFLSHPSHQIKYLVFVNDCMKFYNLLNNCRGNMKKNVNNISIILIAYLMFCHIGYVLFLCSRTSVLSIRSSQRRFQALVSLVLCMEVCVSSFSLYLHINHFTVFYTAVQSTSLFQQGQTSLGKGGDLPRVIVTLVCNCLYVWMTIGG